MIVLCHTYKMRDIFRELWVKKEDNKDFLVYTHNHPNKVLMNEIYIPNTLLIIGLKSNE